MSWVTILVMLLLSGITAFLVIIRHWDFEEAAGMMIGVSLAMCAMLVVLGYLITPPSERAEMWKVMRKTMLDDLKGMIKLLVGK